MVKTTLLSIVLVTCLSVVKDTVVKPSTTLLSFESQLDSNLNQGVSLMEFSRKKSFSPFQFSFQPVTGQTDIINPYDKACDGAQHTPPLDDLTWIQHNRHVTMTRPAASGISPLFPPAFLHASPNLSARGPTAQPPIQHLAANTHMTDSRPSLGMFLSKWSQLRSMVSWLADLQVLSAVVQHIIVKSNELQLWYMGLPKAVRLTALLYAFHDENYILPLHALGFT